MTGKGPPAVERKRCAATAVAAAGSGVQESRHHAVCHTAHGPTSVCDERCGGAKYAGRHGNRLLLARMPLGTGWK